MIRYLEFILTTSFMVISYQIIALKYIRSTGFSSSSSVSKLFHVGIHVIIVITNIALYFWMISQDIKLVHVAFKVTGLLIFVMGTFIILWGFYSLSKEVFIPGKKFIISGPFAIVRHPMYLGGIVGAFGLALLAGSMFAFVYSFILALVLLNISEAEERELKTRFGDDYIEYMKKVPKIFPLRKKT